MKSIDSSLLAQLFFGISLVVFLITLYIILPAFIYNKRTLLRPELINGLWYRTYDVLIEKWKMNRGGKKKENLNSSVQIDVIRQWKTSKQKIRLGLYEH